MEILEKMFGNATRVKIMKLFLFNQDLIFDKLDILEKAKVGRQAANKELNLLERINFIRKISFYKEFKANNNKGSKKKRVQGYAINLNFRYLFPLQRMLIDSTPMENKEIAHRLSRTGKVKLVVASGVFIQDQDSRVDLLIVGDDINQKKVKNIISIMEADIGRSLRYTIFNTGDFKYRLGVCDRLVRDIFDYPHEVVMDKIGV